MKKNKITLAVVAFVASIGLTSAAYAFDKADKFTSCNTQPDGSGTTIDDSRCSGITVPCCYYTSTTFKLGPLN